ncbi:MAG TPA: helix-turn-helix domain-containing protein, partial [Terriglobales bacterium]|nr:helix-turn-helix domain-containing protein [Terriglobales bacterium]
MAQRLKPKVFSDFPKGSGVIGFRPKTMREMNSRDLLQLLRHHMPCSRADLVRLSGLTAPTVSAAIAALHRRGLVRFNGPGSPKGGRPPRILEFNAQCAYVLAADIGGAGVRLVLADLGGNITGTINRSFTDDGTPEEVVALCAAG